MKVLYFIICYGYLFGNSPLLYFILSTCLVNIPFCQDNFLLQAVFECDNLCTHMECLYFVFFHFVIKDSY